MKVQELFVSEGFRLENDNDFQIEDGSVSSIAEYNEKYGSYNPTLKVPLNVKGGFSFQLASATTAAGCPKKIGGSCFFKFLNRLPSLDGCGISSIGSSLYLDWCAGFTSLKGIEKISIGNMLAIEQCQDLKSFDYFPKSVKQLVLVETSFGHGYMDITEPMRFMQKCNVPVYMERCHGFSVDAMDIINTSSKEQLSVSEITEELFSAGLKDYIP